MKTTKMSVIAASLLLAGGMMAQAEEPKGWKFELTPYAWLAGLEGDATVNGKEADFDKSFSDIVDAVELGGSLLGVAQYDRYLLWGQVDYFSLSTDAMDVEDQPAGGSMDSTMFLAEVAVGYQIDGWAEGQTFDLLVGVRTLSLDMELDLDAHGKFSNDRSITDPIFVVRPSIPVLPSKIDGLRFNPTLAIGGGGDSDLVYELFPQFQYQINDSLSARVGYRTVGYKFEDDDNELNVNLAGLIVGLGMTF